MTTQRPSIYFSWKVNFRKFKKSSLLVQNLYLGWRRLISHSLSCQWIAHRQLFILTRMNSWWSVVLIEISFLFKFMTPASMCDYACVLFYDKYTHISLRHIATFVPRVCVCFRLFGWSHDLWLFDREERELGGGEERGMERRVEGLMNRVVWKKVSLQKKRGMRSLSLSSPVASNPHTQTHTPSTFHQQQQQPCPSLLLYEPLFFLKLYSVLTQSLFLSAYLLILSSLVLLVSPAQFWAVKSPSPWFISPVSYKWNPTNTLITVISLLLTSLSQLLFPSRLPALLLHIFLPSPSHPVLL